MTKPSTPERGAAESGRIESEPTGTATTSRRTAEQSARLVATPPSSLLELQPWLPVAHTLLCWSAIISAWALVAWQPVWWAVLLAVPVIGNRYYALFILGHDAFHNRIFRSTRANDLFANLFLHGPIGAVNRINRENHLNHHRLFATGEDPDRHKYISANKSSAVRYLGFLTGLASLSKAFANVFRKPVTQPDAPDSGYTAAELSLLLAWQALLLIGLSYFIGWWAYPLLWLLPAYAFTYVADLVRSFCEHSQPGPDAENDALRLITYRANRLERMLFAPMNMNFHAAHHLWPGVPYYHLPAADDFLHGSAAREFVEWRDSYLGYLRRFGAFVTAGGRGVD